MSKLLTSIAILTLLTSSIHAKKTLLGKAFEKVILHSVDKTLEDLDKGEQSKIINYYNNMSSKINIPSKPLEDINHFSKSNKKILEYSLNGITIIAKYPSSIRKGKSFVIEAKMVNDFKDAKMGGLTLSFPQYSSLDGAIVGEKFDSVKGYAPPQKMYSSSCSFPSVLGGNAYENNNNKTNL